MVFFKSIRKIIGPSMVAAENQHATFEESHKVLRKKHEGLTHPEYSPQSVLDATTLTEINQIEHSRRLYRYIKYLGKGSNGFVVLSEDMGKNENHALKLIDVALAKSKYMQSEILNHFKLKHPHIISLEEIFVTDEHLVLVTEFADQGDLFSYIKHKGGLDEGESRWLFQQIILAVDFCHRMDIVHRDIKPENILLSSTKDGRKIVKLCDFGFSKDVADGAARTRLGTPMYMAPEVMNNRPGGEYDGRQSDVWSCGVVLYVMLSGRYPPVGFASEGGTTSTFDAIPRVSAECHYILSRMLNPCPQKRAAVSEVMSSSWFSTGLGKDLAAFNTRILGRLQKSPRVTATTVDKVRGMINGSGQTPV